MTDAEIVCGYTLAANDIQSENKILDLTDVIGQLTNIANQLTIDSGASRTAVFDQKLLSISYFDNMAGFGRSSIGE